MLEKQEIELPLNLGMATKPSAELQDPGSMRLVQNLHWRGLGELEKVPAVDVQHTVAEPSGSQYDEQNACGLVLRENDAVVVTGRHGVMTYSERTGLPQWARRDIISSVAPDAGLKFCPVSYDVSRRFIERAQFNAASKGIYQVASAQYNGVHAFGWIELGLSGNNTLRFKAIDAEKGTVLATTEFRTLSGSFFSVQACEYTEAGKEGVLFAYVDGSAAPYTVSTVRYDAAANQFVADSNLTTDLQSVFTLTKNGNRVYFGYQKNTGSILTVEDRTIGSITTTHTGTHSAAFSVAIVKGNARTLIVSCTTTTAYAEVFGTPAAAITVATAASELFAGITAAAESLVGTTDDAVVWVNSIVTGTPTGVRVRSFGVNFDTTTASSAGLADLPHCRVVANGFTLRGHAHVALAVLQYQSVTGTSAFVARVRRNGSGLVRHDPVAKLCHDRYFIPAYAAFDLNISAYVDANHNAWLGLTADAGADAILAAAVYPQTIFLARIAAQRPMPQPYASPQPGVVMVAGGMPWQYDGDTPSEITPIAPPKTVLDTTGTTGAVQTGNFSVIAVYRWVDTAGRVHRMAGDSVVTGAISGKRIDVYVSKCPLRAYLGGEGPDMEPELYITDGTTDTTHYLANDASGNKLLYDSTTANGLWYVFTGVDPTPNSGQSLAILTGDEVEPEPVPAFFHIAKVVDRMVAVDAEDRSRIWYSKPLVAEFGVEWSTAFTFIVGDDCTATADVRGGMVVLARGGIYLVSGPGPDATGGNGEFAPAVRLNSEVDCIDPVSVCRTPMGVIFRGRRGFYLLTPGLDVQPFAVPIDPEVLTDPALDPSASASYRMRVVWQEQTNEIHVCAPGAVYTFNTLEQKWSKRTLGVIVTSDLAIARGKLWRLDRDNATSDTLRSEKLFAEDGAAYNVDASTGWRIDLAWLKPADMGGNLRLWRAWLSVALPDDPADIGELRLTFYADYNEDAGQVASWSGAELAALHAAGERVVELPFWARNGICKAFKFRVEYFPGASTTSGPRPLSLRLKYGIRDTDGKRLRAKAKG